ncbi:MFS transporter [Nocardia sp. CDC186]|uniref:MFS transporter n=1 Tax=Nocardia implantans TaxID=3108168 RepID=A0ABU6AZT8_9NOCA|nr:MULTISPECIES: MFS transporter [unclassified Nocardia]MBF6195096.1 MFS transporter [Nocardia beijingensis]MEA3530858.1 MFS transporter [Nocardia sp. CDC192]MEB3513012.1 MFS transporter [Nocardia sp. CDC186]
MTELQTPPPVSLDSPPRLRLHPAWLVAAVGFVALLGAAGFRSVPSVLMDPLHEEFGWSHGTIGTAVSLNLLLYGLISPFAAALMDRFGIRRVVACALLLVAAGSGLTVFMSRPWHLVLTWGLLVGIGVGSMSMPFVATITGRWFVRQRGLVTGVLTAAGATGQLVFLPLVSALAHAHGWRVPSLIVAGAALAVAPLVLLFIRDYPSDLGVRAYGAEPDSTAGLRVPAAAGASRALTVLAAIARRPGFWLLAGGFAVCGASTNGLVGTHFVSAAHDHGMPPTTAASLLALVGIFDVAGTIASGWLTDRIDPRYLLIGYYTLRGLSLLILPALLGPDTQPSLWVFIVFYGLDWVATVPPTVVLCRELFGADGPVAFGWVFASHQIGAAVAATGAGLIRDLQGGYDLAWYLAGGLCAAAAVMSAVIRTQAAAG